ncbi:MAG: putative oxidoreductase [Zhongshania sp.]|jgi:putative oxidoreductase
MHYLFKGYYFLHDNFFGLLGRLGAISPLLIRLYLAPVMIAAGLYKLQHLSATTAWLDSGLGLPYPEVIVQLLTYTELLGGFFLLFGFAVRWVSLPLMAVMLVAAFSVHWSNGWFAIAPADPATSTAKPLADLGLPMARVSLENSVAVGERLQRAHAILSQHGNYNWLTDKGDIVVLNNGIEFAATYFILLLSLLFSGGGRWFSLDFYLDRQARASIARHEPAPVVAPTVIEYEI